MSVKIVIDGTDVTSKIAVMPEPRLSATWNGRARLSMSCVPGYIPNRLDEVTCYDSDGTTPLFTGYILQRIVKGIAPGEENAVVDLECADTAAFLDYCYVTLEYASAATLYAVLQNILSQIPASYGITLDPAYYYNQTVEPFSLLNVRASDALRDICNRLALVYAISPYKKLKVTIPSGLSPALSMTDADPHCMELGWEDSTEPPVTTVTLICGKGTTLYSDTWLADGVTSSWVTSIAGDFVINSLTVGGVAKTVGPGLQYEWDGPTHTLSVGTDPIPAPPPPTAPGGQTEIYDGGLAKPDISGVFHQEGAGSFVNFRYIFVTAITGTKESDMWGIGDVHGDVDPNTAAFVTWRAVTPAPDKYRIYWSNGENGNGIFHPYTNNINLTAMAGTGSLIIKYKDFAAPTAYGGWPPPEEWLPDPPPDFGETITGDAAGTDWIFPTPGSTSTTPIVLTYSAVYPFTITKTTGATPEIIHLEIHEDIFDPVIANELLDKLFDELTTSSKTLNINTVDTGWALGKVLMINMPSRSINSSFGITNIEASLIETTYWSYTLQCKELNMYGGSFLGEWRELLGGTTNQITRTDPTTVTGVLSPYYLGGSRFHAVQVPA